MEATNVEPAPAELSANFFLTFRERKLRERPSSPEKQLQPFLPSFINNLVSLFYREKGGRRSFENRGNPPKIRKKTRKKQLPSRQLCLAFFYSSKLPIQSSVFVSSIFGLPVSYPSTVSIRSNSVPFLSDEFAAEEDLLRGFY